jgi:tRNA(fMet)-specific endonuclease VapC
MRFLLDANIISDIGRRPDSVAAGRYRTNGQSCGTSIIVAAELRYGIAKHPERRGAVRASELLEKLSIAVFEAPADAYYGAIRAELERAGTPISSNDLLIAAHALALDCILVTANEREFRLVPELKVENWCR